MKGMNATWDERARRAAAYAQAGDQNDANRPETRAAPGLGPGDQPPVCDSVQVAPSSKPYGCHNRTPFADATVMQDGWATAFDIHGNPRRMAMYRMAPFRMARDCRYTHTTLGQADPRCTGCTHRTDNPEGD